MAPEFKKWSKGKVRDKLPTPRGPTSRGGKKSLQKTLKALETEIAEQTTAQTLIDRGKTMKTALDSLDEAVSLDLAAREGFAKAVKYLNEKFFAMVNSEQTLKVAVDLVKGYEKKFEVNASADGQLNLELIKKRAKSKVPFEFGPDLAVSAKDVLQLFEVRCRSKDPHEVDHGDIVITKEPTFISPLSRPPPPPCESTSIQHS